MKSVRYSKVLCCFVILFVLMQALPRVSHAYSEGTIRPVELSEQELMSIVLDALVDHLVYSESIYNDYSHIIPGAGYFGDGSSVEHGIRTHNNYCLLYAFLYAEGPDTLDKDFLKARALAGIRYGVNTHRAIGEYLCPKDNRAWGLVWQSSLWTTSLGYAGHMLWDELDQDTQGKLVRVIEAEADLIAGRVPSSQVVGNTLAEENGWDTNIVALAANMFPNHPNADRWDYKAKEFAMNTLSMRKDLTDESVVDGKPVKEWVVGPNLFDDFTMENHNIFHPMYQMVPLIELGDSMVFYKAFGNTVPKAFEHNVLEMYNSVLKKIILANGEWAYINGCDWSIELLDHINAVALMSTYYKDVDSKMLESRLVQYIRARQLLYDNGMFIGPHSDVKERRESVQAKRLIYMYLLHKYFGPWSEESTTWQEFAAKVSGNQVYANDAVVLNRNSTRFASFSWRNKFMGLIVPDSDGYLDDGFVTFPYQKSLTGSFVIVGTSSSQAYVKHNINLQPTYFTTTGLLSENGGAIDHYMSFTALPGNAVVYMDVVKANTDLTVTWEQGIPIALQSDDISGKNKTLYFENGHLVSDGMARVNISGNWVNVDGQLAMITEGSQGMVYGEKTLSNSVYYSTLYGSYSESLRSFNEGDIVANRSAIFYSNIDPQLTADLSGQVIYPTMDEGWKGVVLKDVDGKDYLIWSHFFGDTDTSISVQHPYGAPVLKEDTVIMGNTATAVLSGEELNTVVEELYAFIESPEGTSLKAMQSKKNPGSFYLQNGGERDVDAKITVRSNGVYVSSTKTLKPEKTYLVWSEDGDIFLEESTYPLVPDAPANVVAEEREAAVYLTWTDTTENETGFVIERKDTTGKWIEIAKIPADMAFYEDRDIVRGTMYQYRVYAVTDEKSSSYTYSNQVVTMPVASEYGFINLAEGRPSGASSSQGPYPPSYGNDGDINTFWVSETVYPSPENPVYYILDFTRLETFNRIHIIPRINYGPRDIEIQVSDDGIDYVTVMSSDLPNNEAEFIIDPITARYLRLKITSAYDTRSPSRNAQIRESRVYGLGKDHPAAPVNFTAEVSADGYVRLSWEDLSGNEEGFLVERMSETKVFEVVAVLPPNTTEFTDKDVVKGKEYTYVVSSYNSHGNSYSSLETVVAGEDPVD